MKVEGLLFAGLAVFFGIVAAAYWVLSREPAGTAALVLSGGLGFIVGYYLLFTSRRIDPRPEDDLEANVSDGAGDMGFFSPLQLVAAPRGVQRGGRGRGSCLRNVARSPRVLYAVGLCHRLRLRVLPRSPRPLALQGTGVSASLRGAPWARDGCGQDPTAA